MANDPANPTPDPAAPPPVQTVPYERFSAVVGEKKALMERVAALETEARTYQERAATADTLASRIREMEQASKAQTEQFGAWRDVAKVLPGVDEDIFGLVEAQYGRLPAKDRPARSAWIEKLREDLDSAPAILRPFIMPPTNGTKQTPRAPGSSTAPASGDTSLEGTLELVRAGKHGEAQAALTRSVLGRG